MREIGEIYREPDRREIETDRRERQTDRRDIERQTE